MSEDVQVTREHKQMRERLLTFFRGLKGNKLEMRKDDMKAFANRVANLLFKGKARYREVRIIGQELSRMLSKKEIVRDESARGGGVTYRLAEARKIGSAGGSQQYINSSARA